MPTVNGNLINAQQLPLETAITFAILYAPFAKVGGGSVVSKGRVATNTDINGDFSLDLAAAQYRATWKDGADENSALITVPDGAGPFEFDAIIASEASPSAPSGYSVLLSAIAAAGASVPRQFATIADMVAAADGSFWFAVTFNGFGATDGIIGWWITVAAADSPRPANTDTRLSVAGGAFIMWNLTQ